MSAAGAAQPSVEVPVSSTSNGDEGFVGDTGVSAVGGDGDPAAGGSGSANLKDHQHSGLLIHHDPTEDEEVSSQLKVREVFNNRETGRVVKSYFPVYSESRQLWLQYRSVEYKVPVDGSNKGPESPANRLRVKKKTAAAGPASPTKAANTDKTTPSPVSEAGAGDTSMGTETTAGAEGTSAEGAPTTEISSTIALPADNTTTATTTTAAATADASTGAFPAVSEPNPTTGDGGADNEQRTDSSKGELPDSTSPVEVVMDLSTSDIAALTQAPADAEANKTPFTVSISAGGGGGDGGDGDGEGNEDAVEQVQLEDDADVPQEEPTAMSAGGDTLPSRAQPSVASPVLTSATPGDNGDAPTATEAATGPADDATVGAPVASLSPHSARSETSAEGSESSLRQPILQMETVEAASAALAMSTPSRSPSSIPAESNKQEHLTVEEKEEENKEENEEEEMPETVFTRLAELLTAHRAGMLGGFINHHPAAESLSAESESSAAAPLLEPLSDGAADEKSLPTADDHRPALSLSPSQQFLQIGEPSVTSEDATTTVPAATATSSIAAIGATNSGTGVPMKKVAEWSAAEILVEKELNFTIVSAKMSFDGTEVVMLLAARVNTKETAEGGEKGEVYPQTTVYYIVSYLPLEQRFHNPFPKLFLPSDRDAVLDFCVGPVAFETLTRTAFVLTKQSLRLFSMHTGRELITNNFPFVWELGSFAPNLVTVCPSQRVVTLAATDDARIAVFLLQHTRDGSSHITSLQEERDLEKRRKLSAKVRAAVPGATMQEEAHVYSVQPHEAAVRTVLNIVVESSPEHFAIQTDAQDIVEALVAHVMKNIDIRAERDRKAGLIAEVYEGKMGFIEPMVWPPMITEVLPLRLTSDSPVEGEGGGENGMQGESPRGGKGRKSKNGRKKNKKERMKGVAQQGGVSVVVDANAQNSEEVTAETYSVVHSDAAEPL